jgi:hypothetical protein
MKKTATGSFFFVIPARFTVTQAQTVQTEKVLMSIIWTRRLNQQTTFSDM